MCSFVALVFDGLNLVDPQGEVARIGKDAAEQFRSFGKIAGKLGEQIKKLRIVEEDAFCPFSLGTIARYENECEKQK